MKIASWFCKHREKLSFQRAKRAQIWQQHDFSNLKNIAIMNRFSSFLQRWIALILLYNWVYVNVNHMWLLIEMQDAKQLYRLRRVERNIFRRHLNRRFDTNLTTTWSFKSQNYFDNESIFVIITTLKCAHFTLQFWLNIWKSYVIVDWSAKCATIIRFSHQKIILMIDLKEFDAFSHSNVDLFQYFQLMKRVSTIHSLIKKFFDRSFASSEYIEHFFIESVLY